MVGLFRRLLVSAACGGAVLIAVPAWAQSATAGAPVKVVASISILADMVRHVGGDRVSVTALVGPDGDAHVFQATPADVKTVADAKVVFINGLGFEGWIERLVQSAAYKGAVVVASAGIRAKTMADAGAKHGHDGHAHGKEAKQDARGALDPHAWQDLRHGLVYVDNILAGLIAADPQGATAYRANAAAYKRTLEQLDAWVRAEIASVPQPRRKVITSHDAFRYFASAYGVTFLAPVGLSTDAEPSAKGVAALIRQIRREKVTALFVENITNPKLIEQIGRETGVKPGGRLYSDALSKPGGPAATYADMFRHNVAQLRAAMSGS